MRVTFIIKDVTDAFFKGIEGSFIGVDQRTDADKFDYLNRNRSRFAMKIGTGQFRDAVELNQIKREAHAITFALLPRKGYRIAEFNFTKAV